MSYVELHCHSSYSFLDGASHPVELAAAAAEQGHEALALTDHDGLHGAMEMAQALKPLGVRPITGAELTLDDGTHLTLLCETREGYTNLCRLLTARHALVVLSAADMVSVFIRGSIVPLVTPDELRGRVNAVEMVFISASNELGAFESGVAAALVGAVPAVVVGGVLTVAVALAWTRFFPDLRHVDRLDDLRPAAAVP